VKITSSDGPASSSTARNTGARLAESPIVLILDDDVVLGTRYLEELTQLYIKNDSDSLAGIGGFDPSLREKSIFERFYSHLFYLGINGWRINKVGIQSWDPTVESVTQSDWLPGNNASYKRDLLIEYPFPHWSGGREPFEDIAVGRQLKNEGYHCLVDPGLPVRHYEQEDTESSIDLGRKRGRNRIKLFRQYCQQRFTPLFLWALLGSILQQFLAPISDSQWRLHWHIGLGMMLGIISLIFSVDISQETGE
jgi:GT2 family glycosyltransferase